jgi:hypothetical protein
MHFSEAIANPARPKDTKSLWIYMGKCVFVNMLCTLLPLHVQAGRIGMHAPCSRVGGSGREGLVGGGCHGRYLEIDAAG